MSATSAPRGGWFATKRVDLEHLAAGYAFRPASDAARGRARRAATAAHLDNTGVAVDVGGGRGEHAAQWTDSGALVVVVDPARGMLSGSAGRSGVCAICGIAQQLPLRTGSTRLVYFHLSIHYGNWRRSLDEALRVLEPGGSCWVWTMGEEHHRNSFLARWFPSVAVIDAARFPDPFAVAAHLARNGAKVSTGREVESKTVRQQQWHDAVRAGFVSTLQLITSEELEVGLARFNAVYPDPEQPVDYVLTFDWIHAIR